MGKTRDLFKKIRDTEGTFHAKTGSIKDRNGMDLTEAEEVAGIPPNFQEMPGPRSGQQTLAPGSLESGLQLSVAGSVSNRGLLPPAP